MGRLIDADKLLETLQDLEPHCENKDFEYGMSSTMNYYMPKIINDEPTAYDVDKVVEQLKEVKKIMSSPVTVDCFGEECRASDCTVCLIRKAIEIVKGGALWKD